MQLDEIGDIKHDIQVKLLRFLEHKVIRPLGGPNDIQLDIQIVAATNKNLDIEVERGKFREDLRQRMNYKIEIPPLRERTEDILPIFNYYIEKKHHFKPSRDVVPEIFNRVLQYDWPGNVRQLFNLIDAMIIERALLKKNIIDMVCFEAAFENINPKVPSKPKFDSTFAQIISLGATEDRKLGKAIDDMRQIETILQNPNYKKSAVAKILGYKGLDHMRARIKTCYGNYPDIFEHFPKIKEFYI